MISTVDTHTGHAHKTRERRQVGFKDHMVINPDTGLSTAVAVTKASGPENSNAAVGVALLERDTTIESSTGNSIGVGFEDVEASKTVDVLADSACGTADMSARLGAPGHTPLIKPWRTKPAVEGGFAIEDFAYDQGGGTLTCHAGVTLSLTAQQTVAFGVACRGCPLRERCTAAPAAAQ